MSTNITTRLGPEDFDVANAYLTYGTVKDTAEQLDIPQHEVVKILRQTEVKRYLDGVYLDMGYRNREKLGQLLDKIIDKKIEEAEETEVYTSKDLVELIQLAHKMRMDEIKLEKEQKNVVDNSTNVQVAAFGDGNYGKLMERLLGGK